MRPGDRVVCVREMYHIGLRKGQTYTVGAYFEHSIYLHPSSYSHISEGATLLIVSDGRGSLRVALSKPQLMVQEWGPSGYLLDADRFVLKE